MIIEFRTATESSLLRRFRRWSWEVEVGTVFDHTYVKEDIVLYNFRSSGHTHIKYAQWEIDEVRAISRFYTRLVSGQVGTTLLEKYIRTNPNDNFIVVRIKVTEEEILSPLFDTHDFFKSLWLNRDSLDVYVKPGGISEVALHAPDNPQEGFDPIYFYHHKLGELRPETEARWLDEAVWETVRYIKCTRRFVKHPHRHDSDLRLVRSGWTDQTALGALLDHLNPDP